LFVRKQLRSRASCPDIARTSDSDRVRLFEMNERAASITVRRTSGFEWMSDGVVLALSFRRWRR
jgi:hypothetical protein